MIIATVALLVAAPNAVELEANIRPVPEVIAKIQPSFDHKLLVSDAFRNRKLSVFCEGSNPEEILEAIATALDAKWLKKDSTWTLAIDSKAYDLADRYQRTRMEVARQALAKNLASNLALARKFVPKPVKREPLTIRPNPSPVGGGGGGDNQSTSSTVNINSGGSLEDSLNAYPAAWKYLAGLPGPSIDKLIRGDILIGSDRHINPAHRLPANFAGANDDSQSKMEKTIAFFHINDDQAAIKIRAFSRGEDSTSSNTFQLALASPSGEEKEDPRLVDHPFRKQLAEWRDGLNSNPDLKIKMSNAELGEIKWSSGAISLSEQMRWFHRSTGLPVVVEAFRTASEMGAPKIAADAGEWLGGFAKKGLLLAKMQGHTLVARQPQYWDFRKNEIPESNWESTESTARNRPLFLSDYAAFLGQLNDDQLAGLSARDHLATVQWPDLNPDTVAVLRFYGALSKGQQQDIFTAPLESAALSSEQMRLANLAIRSGITGFGRVVGAWIKDFDQNTSWPTAPIRVGCTTHTSEGHFMRINQNGNEPPKTTEGYEPLTEFRFTLDEDNYMLIVLSLPLDEAHLKRVEELKNRTENQKNKGGS